MAVPQDVKDIAPELSGESDARVQLFLDQAEMVCTNGMLEANVAAKGQVLLAAHYLTLANRASSGGPITSEKAGDLAVGYGTMEFMGRLDLTAYGSMFKQLCDSNIINPTVVEYNG